MVLSQINPYIHTQRESEKVGNLVEYPLAVRPIRGVDFSLVWCQFPGKCLAFSGSKIEFSTVLGGRSKFIYTIVLHNM